MESFLKLVATDLYNRTQGDLAHTAVVHTNLVTDLCEH